MKHINKSILNSLLFLLITYTMPLQSSENLLSVYEKAFEHDPTIRAAKANYQAILELKPQAMSYFFPALTFNTSSSQSNSEDMNPMPDYRTGRPITGTTGTGSYREARSISLNLNQTIFDMTAINGLSLTNKRLAQAEALYNYEKQNLFLRVSESYFNVLAAQDRLVAQTTAREAIGRQLDLAQSRFELGLIPVTDVQESQAGYDLAIASEIESKRLLSSAKEFLREIVGEYIDDLELAGGAKKKTAAKKTAKKTVKKVVAKKVVAKKTTAKKTTAKKTAAKKTTAKKAAAKKTTKKVVATAKKTTKTVKAKAKAKKTTKKTKKKNA